MTARRRCGADSLLFKAKSSTLLETDLSKPEGSLEPIDPPDLLFSGPMTETEAIPAPRLFMGVIQRQWVSPGAYSNPMFFGKKIYNVNPDLTELLQILEVDEPVMALASPSAALFDAEDVLKPDEVELLLRKATKQLPGRSQLLLFSTERCCFG